MRAYRFALFSGFLIFVLSTCALPLRAQITDILLQSFTGVGGTAPGASPDGTLIVDSSGNFYGTTTQGGTYNAGVVFKLDASSGYAETVLHEFTGNPTGDGDGAFPIAGVVINKASNTLYGTTSCGGDQACNSNGTGGDGIIYEFNLTSGTYTVLYRFGGTNRGDGSRPYAPLIRAGGYLYGTTTHGGRRGCADAFGDGCGTLFRVSATTGRETILYSFTGGTDGGVPFAPVVRDNVGRYDGTTSIGGQNNVGTIFTFVSNNESVLYNFTGGTDGGLPYAGLTVDSANNLYGTTTAGGGPTPQCAGGNGVVFKWSSSMGLQTLHTFCGAPNDGAMPVAGVLLDYVGNLCGTTEWGGNAASMGTLFTLTGNSGYQTELVHDFLGAPNDGANPVAGLTFGTTSKKKQLCPVGSSAESQPPKKGTCTYVCGAAKSGGLSGEGGVFQTK